MKKVLYITLGLLCFVFLIVSLRFLVERKVIHDFGFGNASPNNVSPTPFEKVTSTKEEIDSVFVPYWALSGEIEGDEDRFIYFGIAPTEYGIDTTDEGYKKLGMFIEGVNGEKEIFLTLRMLDQETNFAILEDTEKQRQVIEDTISVANAYGFDGIVLDLELKALPFDSIVTQINTYVRSFYQAVKSENMVFSVATYGDTFYRIRPFDIKTIGDNADEILIMAYDFHKSGGNPGPNFPLKGSQKYGYDYYEMMDDYLAVVPADKITVVFGMFGYNWPVDDKDNALSSATSLSLLQGQSRYIDSCAFESCTSFRDSDSSEMSVSYIDSNSTKRIVWFEDLESVNQKKTFLKDRGISSFSYWAYSFY